MRLETVIIKNFRSIQSIQLNNCGDFNVFIGKNNSGKSSILTAINSFFKCIQNGQLVSLKPPIGKEIDFCGRKTQIPIDINLGFSLFNAEKELLMQDIMTEAPQMKNAVNGIGDSLKLFISLRTITSPHNFCFVNEIYFEEKANNLSNEIAGKNTILKISDIPAKEIYKKQVEYSKKQELADNLEKNQAKKGNYTSSRIRRVWDIAKESEGASFFISEILSDSTFSVIKKELEEIFQESSSYNDFWKSTKAISKKIREDAINEIEQSLDSSIDTFTGQESNIPKYVKNLLGKISELSILHLTERRKPIGQEEAKRLLSLKVKRGGEEDLHNIQETVLSLLGVKIDAFQGESSPFSGNDSAELDVDNFLVEANGSGIREALRLVLDVEFGKPQILLVEEPEIHLHPALETSMMRYLKRTSLNCQVFLTTHSTNFLDTAEMKNVYLISKPESTQVQKLNIQEAEEQIPKELGIRLSSLFMFDRLVFVEGKSDEDIFREWASILGINLSQSNVGFIPMGGVRNFAHFATESTLSFLTKRQVKMWFIIDKDEKEDSEIVKLQERLGDNASVICLKKREIENYFLLCPRIIIKFIAFKIAASGNKKDIQLDENEIVNLIENCAEDLKQFAIEKRAAKVLCKNLYFPSVFSLDNNQDFSFSERVLNEIERLTKILKSDKQKVEFTFKQISENVEQQWQSNKLSIVPGDLLIDIVCKKYGVRFKKEKDGSRLASFMMKDEIDSDIEDIIRKIGG